MKPIPAFSLMFALLSIAAMAPVASAQQGVDLARAAAAELAKELGDKEQATYEEAARSYFDWGAIIRPDGKVLSVREGSVAATMGLRENDQVEGINALQVSGDSLGEVLQYLASLEHGSQLTVQIKRSGEDLQLTGQVLATVVPGWRLHIELPRRDHVAGVTASSSACGRLSVFLQPSIIDHYPARIISINGEPLKSLSPNLVLPVGEHIIGLVELIDNRQVSRSGAIDQVKLLSVVVEADKKYHLGSHFVRSKRYERANQNYWEPVVWKVTEQSCSLD
ncbi:PDZ domain-containing protein [Pseudidiomarina mangrovi]|uniref:PDZ domain-containing protein n=1 Tax=Pseudidiomarina mangrovi TaxID=2487133 RepID=UPI000FCAFF21|nr:PDZ domain-containing protein [Pseudidiomarina mangrovi]